MSFLAAVTVPVTRLVRSGEGRGLQWRKGWLHFGQVECRTPRAHASRELELGFGVWRQEQDGAGQLRVTSKCGWESTSQEEEETEKEGAEGALQERPTLGKVCGQS